MSPETNKTILRLEQQIKSLQKEFDDFAYAVSHDVKAPLRHILSAAEFLKANGYEGLSDDSKKLIDIMVRGSHDIQHMMEHLVSYSKIKLDAGGFVDVDLKAVLEKVCDLLRDEIQNANAQINVEDIPVVFGHEGTLTRVFYNLIENAIKFSKDGVEPVIRISSKTYEGGYKICVADNGVGVKPALEDKIFMMFHTLNPGDARHEGIGLPECKKIMQGHGGKIYLDHTYKDGTQFILEFKGEEPSANT